MGVGLVFGSESIDWSSARITTTFMPVAGRPCAGAAKEIASTAGNSAIRHALLRSPPRIRTPSFVRAGRVYVRPSKEARDSGDLIRPSPRAGSAAGALVTLGP